MEMEILSVTANLPDLKKVRKGLECCDQGVFDCPACPYDELEPGKCMRMLFADAIALINHWERMEDDLK